MPYPKKLLHTWQQGGKQKTENTSYKEEWSNHATHLKIQQKYTKHAALYGMSASKYINLMQKNIMENISITPVNGFTVGTVYYNFTKQDLETCFISYFKQEIQYEQLKEYVLAYVEYLKVVKPEYFTSHAAISFKESNTISYAPKKYAEGVKPSTQKAKGIQHIYRNNGGFDVLPFEILTGAERDQQAVKDFMEAHPKVFARPCPETPRHGFVDSRVVESVDDVHKLYDEVRRVDAKGELVIMKPIKATKNCVITENSITIGPGHDGATAGINAKVLPIFGTWKKSFEDISAAGIAEGDVPYLETVTKEYRHYLVQMRGGPAITSRALDYVPVETTVQRVVKATGDLLEWETTMKELAGVEGVVVDHVGGALTSHYGVHAILNRIPVVTQKAPSVGDVLAVANDTVTHNYMSVVNGIVDSLSQEYVSKKASDRVAAMIYATQYFSALGGTQAYFIGHGVGTMLNFGLAACAGEYRYHPNNPKKGQGIRKRIYTKATRDFITSRKRLGKYAQSYATDSWPGSFGGLKWYECASAIIELDTATRAFLKNPQEATFNEMMMCQNKAINCAHNGGWWFNKYVEESVFNHINDEYLPTILNAVSYLADQPAPEFTLESLRMYGDYSNAKMINPKLVKDVARVPYAAQVRLVNDPFKPVDMNPDMEINQIRLQVKWSKMDSYHEQTLAFAGVNQCWDWDNKEYKTSWASTLEGYLPVSWKVEDDKVIFMLASNGLELHREPVSYTYAKAE